MAEQTQLGIAEDCGVQRCASGCGRKGDIDLPKAEGLARKANSDRSHPTWRGDDVVHSMIVPFGISSPARRFVEMTENLVVWLEPLKLLLQDRLSYPHYRGARDRGEGKRGPDVAPGHIETPVCELPPGAWRERGQDIAGDGTLQPKTCSSKRTANW
jgi:hypothetical protein